MEDESHEPQDGSLPERGTGQRQDHRAAPPGHRIPDEPPNLDDPEAAEEDEEAEESSEPGSSESDRA